MVETDMAAGDVCVYLALKGTLAGSDQQKLEQIINEKFVANFGVVMEPWNDWRRTGYPAIQPLPISVAVYNEIPRSIVYPLSETNSNPNTPKRTDLLQRVFWDN